MELVRKAFWVLVTIMFTFLFSVLFEHGTVDFAKNLEKDLKTVRDFIKPPPRKPDTSDKIPAK